MYWVAVLWVNKKHVSSVLFHGLVQEKFQSSTYEDRANLLPWHLAFLMFLYYTPRDKSNFRKLNSKTNMDSSKKCLRFKDINILSF